MLIPSHLQLEPSNSRTRVPAGGIDLIASIDFKSDGATTATLSSSTKVSHGEDTISSAEVATPNHSNQQYSIYAITDAAANIAERYAYTAYGQPTFLNAAASVIATSAISNRYTYTAREWDATVGLFHFRARWMSGVTGRFLTRDPIGYASGSNLNGFLDCRPLRDTDPTGLIVEDCGKFVGCKGKRVFVREGEVDAVPDGDMIDPQSGVQFEGSCGCLVRQGPFTPPGLLDNVINAGLCSGIDDKAAKEILEKEKPDVGLAECACGEKCKVTGLRSIVVMRDIPPGGLKIVVYVKLSILRGCLVKEEPWAENGAPCTITIPETAIDELGGRITSRLTLLFTQGTCQKIGP